MQVFETILVLLLVATALSAFARRLSLPYPALLAMGGVVLAFIPGAPRLAPPPDLILALFVAPILLDAAYDASLRDLRRSWAPLASLILVAVALTTVAVAIVARMLMPDMPWAAAVALGALLAPPDAVAALAVMRHAQPPHQIRVVLEGESLLNDASALLIYRLAVGAVAAGSFSLGGAAPAFVLVFFGSVAAGWFMAWPVGWISRKLPDAPSSVIFQFVATFCVWLAAERLHLSGVVTVVVFGVTLAQKDIAQMPARFRVPSFAIWETATVVLNVLAFTLIGLQLGPIIEPLSPSQRVSYLAAAAVILAVVVGVRLGWTLIHNVLAIVYNRFLARGPRHGSAPSLAGAVVVGWSGMRGIVTLAAALALPQAFPNRDFIQFCAFVVVLGTLVIQGLTLRPLMKLLGLRGDNVVETELAIARKVALKAAMDELSEDQGEAAERLRAAFAEALSRARRGRNPADNPENRLRARSVAASRRAITELRSRREIGDDAYRQAEEELDWLELSASGGGEE